MLQRRSLIKRRIGFLAIVILLGYTARPAHAYIDPGTGSSLLSMLGLMVGMIGAGVAICYSFIKQWGGLFVAKFTSRRTTKESSQEVTD
jgi:hypothetical protein